MLSNVPHVAVVEKMRSRNCFDDLQIFIFIYMYFELRYFDETRQKTLYRLLGIGLLDELND